MTIPFPVRPPPLFRTSRGCSCRTRDPPTRWRWSVSFFGWDMRDDALQTVARVARQLQPVVHRRKVLVCIGNRDTCDPYFEVPENSILWPSWRDALSAAARANASVYAVSPAGVESRFDLGYGLVDNSGGGDFAR